MDQRWAHIAALFERALERDPSERQSFLRAASADDSDLRRQVDGLLAEDGSRHLIDGDFPREVVAWLTDNAGVLAGATIGSFAVDRLIGVGGMGEVYRARDTRLGRDVALKILPAAFANDPERRARFTREAQMLASLNHPNIAAIHGFEDSAGVHALVLELVEGPTLADRIAGGRLPMGEALPIARQIADALECAHEAGIVHRDLKPANIKVREDGTVKVLDFGLAKLAEPAGAVSSVQLTQSPTITTPAMTAAGLILGTAAYMSPEQARGKPADKRSDMWAFGCVLYEMLTGKRAFAGEDVADTLANVLKTEPDWTAISRQVPLPVSRLVRRCLEKDRTRRLDSAVAARLDLDEARETRSQPAPAPASWARERIAWAAALAVMTLIAAVTVMRVRQGPGAAHLPELRLDIVTPPTDDPFSFALSPDGRRVVFLATYSGISRLWLRSLDAVTAEPLPGTDGARYPFWAPDSRSVAFFTNQALERIDLGASRPRVLAPVGSGRGGTWGADGIILFAPSGGPLFRVSASGGEAVAVSKIDPPRVRSHRFPSFLPGTRTFLFYATGSDDASGIYLGALDSPDVRRLTAADSAGVFMPPGSLLYVRQGALVSRPFDQTRGTLGDEAVTIADPVGADEAQKVGAFSASSDGLVIYRAVASIRSQLAWFDRTGKQVGTIGGPEDSLLASPKLSPDARQVAVTRTVQGNQDIWLLDGVRSSRFTSDLATDTGAVWSPDGARIAFTSTRRGIQDIYVKPSNNVRAEVPLLEGPFAKPVDDWSRDGRFILFHQIEPASARDLWVLPIDGDRPGQPFVFLRTRFDETGGRFSPNGEWVAYESNVSGQWEIYLRAFSADVASSIATSSGGQQVSTSGGIQPQWRHDGTELYYIAPGGALMAAPIATTRSRITIGTPFTLFQTRIVGNGTFVSGLNGNYDAAADGRFLINVMGSDATVMPITVLQHWSGKASP
jgi:eukaryotic-like serine/threonine-protein kinase